MGHVVRLCEDRAINLRPPHHLVRESVGHHDLDRTTNTLFHQLRFSRGPFVLKFDDLIADVSKIPLG